MIIGFLRNRALFCRVAPVLAGIGELVRRQWVWH